MRTLPDLTMQIEKRRAIDAVCDFWRYRALGRSLDLLPSSPHHDRVKAAAIDDAALRNAASAFVEVAKAQTVLGQLAQWTLPAVPGAPVVVVGDVAADFVQQGQPIPAAAPVVTSVTAEVTKLAFLVAFNQRSFDDSPRGRRAFERALALSIGKAEDAQLLSDTPAAVGVRPAGLRAGAPVFPVATSSSAAMADALSAAIAAVSGGTASSLVAIAPSSTAAWLSTLLDAGSLGSVPTIIASAGPPLIVLLDAAALAVVDDGLSVDSSTQAAIGFSTPPAAQPSPLVSLYQTNAVSLRVARYIWWHAPAGSVSVVDPAGALTRRAA